MDATVGLDAALGRDDVDSQQQRAAPLQRLAAHHAPGGTCTSSDGSSMDKPWLEGLSEAVSILDHPSPGKGQQHQQVLRSPPPLLLQSNLRPPCASSWIEEDAKKQPAAISETEMLAGWPLPVAPGNCYSELQAATFRLAAAWLCSTASYRLDYDVASLIAEPFQAIQLTEPPLPLLWVAGDMGLQQLEELSTAEAAALRSLVCSGLDDKKLRRRFAAVLRRQQGLQRLVWVEASSCSIGTEGCAALAKCSSLTTLNLFANRIGPKGAGALAKCPSLRNLGVVGNMIGDDGAAALAECPSLTALNAADNSIGDSGAAALASCPSVNTLNVDFNMIGDGGAAALARRPVSLTALSVAHNSIGDDGATALAKHLSLITLDVRGNSIGPNGLAALANCPSLDVDGLDEQSDEGEDDY